MKQGGAVALLPTVAGLILIALVGLSTNLSGGVAAVKIPTKPAAGGGGKNK